MSVPAADGSTCLMRSSAATVYAGDGFTYGSGAASPFPPGVAVYTSEPTPAYCSTSGPLMCRGSCNSWASEVRGTVSPLPAAYADEGAVYGWSGAANALPPRVLATKLPPSAYDASGAARLASGQATWMEPTTVANQCMAPDAPAATLSAISNGISSNGYASTRISSYAPAMPSVAGGSSCVLPAVMHPRASTPTAPARYSIASPAVARASVSGSSTPVVPVGSQWGAVSPMPPPPA
eukprot:s2502_g1.t2